MRSIRCTSPCYTHLLSRDTCDIHILHLKVNLLLYICLLGALEDGILLDPPLPCILRFKSYTCIEEEVKRKGTTTPFMTLNVKGSIAAFSISKSVEPNEERKILIGDFGQGITASTER